MKKYLLLSLFLYLAVFSACNPSQQKPPNILFIMVDDLGWKDVGFMGRSFFETPNIDRLANSGMIFTRSYAAASNCAPSRACLMSGQYAPRHGIYTVSPSARGKASDRKLVPVTNTNRLADSTTTLAELCKEAGYVTGTFGKWHLGPDPTTQGFDVNVGGNQRGNPGRNGYWSPYKVSPLSDGPEGEYLTDRLTTEAIDFLHSHKNQPFFLYLPFYSVHTPLLAKESLIEKYQNKPGNTTDIPPVYAAMVESVDTNIGRLLHHLDSLGLTKNTLIVFTSDNGGIRAISTQAPLRAGKGSYYEGGIRVPTAISWPGIITPGSTSNTPIINLDFFPTFMEILNIEKPKKLLDGQSLMPLFKGDETPDRELFWHFPIYLEAYDPKKDDGRDSLFRTRPGSVIMDGNWKLHQYFEEDEIELYDLTADQGERKNLVTRYPEKAKELLTKLENWREELRAPVPNELNIPITTDTLFQQGGDGYACYRIPAIVTAKDGSVLAFCEARKKGGSDTGDIDLVMKKSNDHGQTWSPMRVIWDDGENVCGNPAPVVDQKTGQIHLLSTWNNGADKEHEIIDGISKDTRRVFQLTSDDNGDTWTFPDQITDDVKNPNWTWYATGPVHGIQLTQSAHKGRLIIPCDHIEFGTKKYYSHVIYSDDHGVSWQLGGTTPQDQVNECTVAELPNGNLMLNMRNYARKEAQARQVAISKDGGLSWQSQHFDTQLPEPRCQAALLSITREGKPLLLFTNPANDTARINMTLSISKNNGLSWPQYVTIYPEHAAYSDLAEMKNGEVIVLHESGVNGAYDGIFVTRIGL